MFTVFVYLIIEIVLVSMAIRLYMSFRKNKNPFVLYFMLAISSIAIGQAVNLAMIAIFFFTESVKILYLSDVIGRTFMYIGAAFLAQLPLYLLFPKSKKRIYVTYTIILADLVFLLYSLSFYYQPYIASNGIIKWMAPNNITVLPGFFLAVIYFSTIGVLIYQFIKSKFRSYKTLLMIIGLILATIGGIGQDFGGTNLEYFLINITMLLGFVLVFIAIFIEEKS